MKDLDHTLDENDIAWFNYFVDSNFDFAAVPNWHGAFKEISVGDFGVKTFKYRNIFNE